MHQTIQRTLSLTVDAAPSGNRPQPGTLNTASAQYAGTGYHLAERFPFWVSNPAANMVGQVAGLVATPHSVQAVTDPVFGPVFKGDGTSRYYKVPYPAVLDFGHSPNMTPNAVSAPLTVMCWVKITISATQLTNFDNPPNMYVFSFNTPGVAPYPGYSLGVCRQFSGSATNIVTEFDLDSAQAQISNYGNHAVNDGVWHHLTLVYPGVAGGYPAAPGVVGKIYVDGVLDVQSNGSTQLPYFLDLLTPGNFPLYLGTDSDGLSNCWQGQFCDLRIYAGVAPASVIQAAYTQATRWQLDGA